MSLDPNVWVSSLPIAKEEINQEKYNLNSNKWINTISKPNKSNSIKKYILTAILFVFGLIIVSAIKNETRNLQKEVGNLITSINVLKFDLHQTTLDHEVITSPENISRLAKEYLESNFVSYKKSQIKQLGKKEKISIKSEKVEFKKDLKEKVKDKKSKMKIIFAEKVETKKIELAKLQELYSKPEKIPKELKLQVEKKIKAKKKVLNNLKGLYSEPKSIFTSKKAHHWAGLQIVKVFLGIPVIPGR